MREGGREGVRVRERESVRERDTERGREKRKEEEHEMKPCIDLGLLDPELCRVTFRTLIDSL